MRCLSNVGLDVGTDSEIIQSIIKKTIILLMYVVSSNNIVMKVVILFLEQSGIHMTSLGELEVPHVVKVL